MHEPEPGRRVAGRYDAGDLVGDRYESLAIDIFSNLKMARAIGGPILRPGY